MGRDRGGGIGANSLVLVYGEYLLCASSTADKGSERNVRQADNKGQPPNATGKREAGESITSGKPTYGDITTRAATRSRRDWAFEHRRPRGEAGMAIGLPPNLVQRPSRRFFCSAYSSSVRVPSSWSLDSSRSWPRFRLSRPWIVPATLPRCRSARGLTRVCRDCRRTRASRRVAASGRRRRRPWPPRTYQPVPSR